jgi:hypothetical protein
MKFATCAAITLRLVCAPPWTIPAFAADDGIPVNRARIPRSLLSALAIAISVHCHYADPTLVGHRCASV